jgi:hypothetical protein
MEDTIMLFEKLSYVFKNSFINFISDCDFSYLEKRELTNEYRVSLIDFRLYNSKTGIQFESQYQYENFVYFFIRDIKNSKCIHFDSYLKFKGYEKENILSLNQIEGKDIPEKFKNYCDYVVRILETDLKGVVEGKEWIEMPIDWMGYK